MRSTFYGFAASNGNLNIMFFFMFLMIPFFKVCYNYWIERLLKFPFEHYFINLFFLQHFWLMHQFYRFAKCSRFFCIYDKHWKWNLSLLMKLRIFFKQDSELRFYSTSNKGNVYFICCYSVIIWSVVHILLSSRIETFYLGTISRFDIKMRLMRLINYKTCN